MLGAGGAGAVEGILPEPWVRSRKVSASDTTAPFAATLKAPREPSETGCGPHATPEGVLVQYV